jgi:outer membrane receptor for ferrienterochelin and colicins
MNNRLLYRCALNTAMCVALPAWSQAPAAPSAASSPAPSSPAPQQLEVTGSLDVEARRRSVTPKLILGREEIERYGDFNVLDVLKRLPSVVVPAGNSGTGGPRLRGLANGFTTILIDERTVPEGFSLETLSTDQVERIEILRAPTAATGARGIAGTINIVLREAIDMRVNDLRAQVDSGRAGASPRFAYSGNVRLGSWTTNASLSAFRRELETQEASVLRRTRVATGALVVDDRGTLAGQGRQNGLTLSTRTIWRGDGGHRFELRPSVGITNTDLSQIGRVLPEEDEDSSQLVPSRSNREARARNWRLESLYSHPWSAARVQWRATFGEAKSRTALDRVSLPTDPAVQPSRSSESTDYKDRVTQLSAKTSLTTDGGHGLDAGVDVQRSRRSGNGLATVGDRVYFTRYDNDLRATIDRVSLFAQDEWALTPSWAAQLGLRADNIKTQAERERNKTDRVDSTIVSPLLHLRWRSPTSAEQLLPSQVRMSLTRSYNAPDAAQLLGNPIINRYYRPGTRNTELNLDFASNSALRPEKSWGIDLAYERYLNEGGVFGASVFYRRIDDLVRNTVVLESVPWAPQLGRYVSRPRNIGKGTASGIELDARVRLSELIEDGPNTSVRANLSVLRSRVRSVPGPDNRLIEQPKGTAYVGLNHRLSGTPLSVGASATHTPGYRLQLQTRRNIVQTKTTVVDAYALYVINSNAQLRLSVANALQRDRVRTSEITTEPVTGGTVNTARPTGASERQVRTVQQRSDAVIGLRLELKL